MTISPATPIDPATKPRTATVIPFPARKPVVAAPAPDDRLARALANLNAALEQQAAAIATWRAALGELKTSTAGLHDSLQRYNTGLGKLGDSVSALGGQARSLEQWADTAMAKRD